MLTNVIILFYLVRRWKKRWVLDMLVSQNTFLFVTPVPVRKQKLSNIWPGKCTKTGYCLWSPRAASMYWDFIGDNWTVLDLCSSSPWWLCCRHTTHTHNIHTQPPTHTHTHKSSATKLWGLKKVRLPGSILANHEPSAFTNYYPNQTTAW